MLKTGKRVLSGALVAVLLMSSLAGCGGNKEAVSISADGSFAPKKELKLTVWETQGTDYSPPSTVQNNVVADWLFNKTKTKIANMYGNDGGQWDPKLTKLVAGDNLPDIVHCGAQQGPAHFAKLNDLGQVWELTPELLEKYCPDVMRRTPKNFWDRIKVDGKIFGIPYMAKTSKTTNPDMTDEELAFADLWKDIPNNDVTYEAPQCLWVRDDVLQKIFPEAKSYDELNAMLKEKNTPMGDDLLDIPIKSTDEFIKFMKDIQALNLTENGKKVYPFGYSGGDNWVALSWLGADMLGYKNHHYTATWNSKTQRIEVPLAGDMIKEAAKIQNDMLRNKIIDPESMAHTSALFKEKVLNGQYAIAPLTMVDIPVNINKQLEEAGKPFRFRPFMTQVPPREGYEPFKEEVLWVESLCVLKTVKEEDLPQVLNWINTQFTDEYEEVSWWGPKEAGLYEETADGKRTYKDERFNKYFIEGDTSVLKDSETMGLGLPLTTSIMRIMATDSSRWMPPIMYKQVRFTPVNFSGFKFPKDSPHVTSVKEVPPCQIYSANYAEIPEVVTFWGEREQWETKFKMAMAADSEDEFNKKWDAAVTELNKMVDIKSMEEKMTEIARPIADKMKQKVEK